MKSALQLYAVLLVYLIWECSIESPNTQENVCCPTFCGLWGSLFVGPPFCGALFCQTCWTYLNPTTITMSTAAVAPYCYYNCCFQFQLKWPRFSVIPVYAGSCKNKLTVTVTSHQCKYATTAMSIGWLHMTICNRLECPHIKITNNNHDMWPWA